MEDVRKFSTKGGWGGAGARILVSLDLLMTERWIALTDFLFVCRGRKFVGMWKIH